MDDFEDRRDRRYEPGSDTFGVHSTAGAVPVSDMNLAAKISYNLTSKFLLKSHLRSGTRRAKSLCKK